MNLSYIEIAHVKWDICPTDTLQTWNVYRKNVGGHSKKKKPATIFTIANT